MLNPKNHVQLIGYVGNSPERTILPSGMCKVTTSLSTMEFYKNGSGTISRITQWHPLVCWGELGEKFYNSVQKGYKLYLNGQLKFIERKDAGHFYHSCHIHVTNFQVIRLNSKIEVVDMHLASEPEKTYQQ